MSLLKEIGDGLIVIDATNRFYREAAQRDPEFGFYQPVTGADALVLNSLLSENLIEKSGNSRAVVQPVVLTILGSEL